MNKIELPIIEEPTSIYTELEIRIQKFFKKHLYFPLLKSLDLPDKTIKNSKKDPLLDALFKGNVFYSQGAFRGTFNSAISKILKGLGATFDRSTGSFKIDESLVPMPVRQMISSSQISFDEKMMAIDDKLRSIIPDDFVAGFQAKDLFDRALLKADRSFQKNVKNIVVAPTLTEDQRAKISEDWQNNMKLYIRDWTEDQIKTLRKQIYDQTISGNRKESLVVPILKITKTIQSSHQQALNKAKFLAHQETRLMMSTFKQARYQQAGSQSYIWRCVHQPHDATPKHHILGNVRYSHGILNGKEFKWNDPPITTNPGQPARRNHPGQDYRCRCHARPIIRF